MLKLLCPACGAEIVFKSSSSVFGACSFCNSMVVRRDLNLETLGKVAELPPDLTPLQIGTRGTYEKFAFELVGRVKVGWEDGNWSEWCALFNDGRSGWLAEAQGFYMMSFLAPDNVAVPAFKDLVVGQKIALDGRQEFSVDDIKRATCLGSQGELPVPSPAGRKYTSVDLSGPNESFASIDYSDDGTRLYVGSYADFDSFNFTALREVDGW